MRQNLQQIVDSDGSRIAVGTGVTAYSYLVDVASIFQQVGMILGPLLVLASLIHVCLKISKQLRDEE